MIRATTGGVLRSYRTNLMNSFIRDNKARETMLTQRVFNSYAEDPASAAKAFRLRKARMQASSQLDVCKDSYYKYQGAFACLQKVSELIDTENGSDMATLKDTALRWLDDPKGDARVQLAKVLDNLSDTIIQNMNQTYGDDFIFAGADGQNVPFEVKEVDGHKQLYYRGIPVDAAVPKVLEDGNGAAIKVNANGEIDPAGEDYLSADAELVEVPQQVKDQAGQVLMVNGNGDLTYDTNGTSYLLAGTPTLTQAEFDAAKAAGEDAASFTSYTDDAGNACYVRKSAIVSMSQDEYQKIQDNAMTDAAGQPYVLTKDGKDYYVTKSDDNVITKADYDKSCKDAEKLEYLAKEKRFVDIGLGLQEDENGKLIESSAFNEALSGLTFLGYGLDEDGDPKNIYSIVQRLKDISDSVPEGGDFQSAWPEFNRLVGKLETASSEFKTQFTNQSAATTKLEGNIELLEDNVYNLKEQYSNLEDVNMADAITSFIWAEYCYNAALKVGNSILSQSLMDYLQ